MLVVVMVRVAAHDAARGDHAAMKSASALSEGFVWIAGSEAHGPTVPS